MLISRSYFAGLLVLLALGCQGDHQLTETKVELIAPSERLRCQHYGGLSEKVCGTSIYQLVVAPEKFDGKHVVFSAQVEIAHEKCFLAAPGFGDSFDISTSIACGSGAGECNLKALDKRFVTIIGKFSLESNDPGILHPAGKIDCLILRGFLNGSAEVE